MERSPYAPDTAPEPSAPPPPCSVEEDPPELECAVCFSQFNNVFNTPKVLQCGHTFCLECLARINIKSSQPESLQCPVCRAYTPLPTLGLPKLATDAVVLSCLPDAMQHVYSIRFSRSRGKLHVKRVPGSVPPSPTLQHRSLDLGAPVAPLPVRDPPAGPCSCFTRVMRNPFCRAFFMVSSLVIMVSLTIGVIFIVRQ